MTKNMRPLAAMLVAFLVAGCATVYQATPEKKAVALAQSCVQMSPTDRAAFPECAAMTAAKPVQVKSTLAVTQPKSIAPTRAASTSNEWPTSVFPADPGRRPIRHLGISPNRSTWGVACPIMVRDAPKDMQLPADLCDKFVASSYKLEPVDFSMPCKDNVEIQNGSVVDVQVIQGKRLTPRVETRRVYQFDADVPLKDRLAKICYVGKVGNYHLSVHQPHKCNNYSLVASTEPVLVATGDCADKRQIGINLVSFSKLSSEMQNDPAFTEALRQRDSYTISKSFGRALSIEGKNGAFALEPHKVRISLVRGTEVHELGVFVAVRGQVVVSIDKSYAEYDLQMEMVGGTWKEVCQNWFRCKDEAVCPRDTRRFTAVLK